MICNKCGNENPNRVGFCMHCGASMTDEEKDVSIMLKKATKNNIEPLAKTNIVLKRNIIIVAGVILFLLILAVFVIIHNSFKISTTEIDFDSEQIYNDYADINEDTQNIEDKYAKDGFVDPKNISNVLNEVETLAKEYKSKGLISSYEKQLTSVYFELNSGVGYLYTPSVKELLSGDGIGKILTIEPYATNSEFIGNYLLGGKSPDKAAEKIADSLPRMYSFSKEDNWDSLSFEQVKNMGKHKIIVWYGHGGYVKKYGSVLGTSISIKDQSSLLLYQLELSNGEMILGKDCFCISPSYFEKHIPNNSLDGSLVFLNACQSAVDNRLANVFINKGASLVVGNSQTIRIRYMLYMMDDFLSALTNQYDDATYWTAEDALAYAKSQNGEKDSEFWAFGAEVKLIYPENKSGYRLCGYNDSKTQNSSQNVSTETTTSSQSPETILSNTCDKVLAFGYDADENYFELVANEKEDYTGTTIEMGIIKNNKWVVELTKTAPFINPETGLINGYNCSIYDKEAEFHYIGAGCFYFRNTVWNGNTNKSVFDEGYRGLAVLGWGSKPVINNEGLFISNDIFSENFKYLDAKTMTFTNINLRSDAFYGFDIIFPLSEGLFACMDQSHDVEANGFYDLNGKKIIDLSKYSLAHNTYYTDGLGNSGITQNLVFKDGKCTFKITNDQGTDYNITIDKTGNVINSEKADDF